MRLALIVACAVGCGVKSEEAEKEAVEAVAAATPETPATPAASPPDGAPVAEQEPAPDPELPGFDAALGRAIVRVEKHHFRVDPFVATLVAEHLAQTGGEPVFRRVPRKQVRAGVPNGFRVVRIEKGSLFHRLGLRQGDVVTKLGTAAPPGPKGLRALLESVEHDVELELTRKGEKITLHYELAGEQSWRDYLEKTAGRKFEDPEDDEPRHASASGSKPAGGGAPSKLPSSSGKPTGGSKPSSSASGTGSPESIPVSCASSSSCTVAKWYFDKVVSSSSQMRSQAKVAPASGGYKLSWVKPGSGVHKLLFRSGDVITRVNGLDLDNQLEALTLYAGLKSTRTYKVSYMRGGKSLTKTIRVV
jgi:hypothetical protein